MDVNPNKAGLYIPGTGQIVVAPDELEGRELATVVVMNPLYVDEIRRDPGRARQPAGRGDRGLGPAQPSGTRPLRKAGSTGGHRVATARRASSQAALSTSPSSRPDDPALPRPASPGRARHLPVEAGRRPDCAARPGAASGVRRVDRVPGQVQGSAGLGVEQRAPAQLDRQATPAERADAAEVHVGERHPPPAGRPGAS